MMVPHVAKNALVYLCDPEARKAAGILMYNDKVFANSGKHCTVLI
jgi:hypothetical protein